MLEFLRETAKVVKDIPVEFKKRPAGFLLSGEKDKDKEEKKQADNSATDKKKPEQK